MYNDNKYSCYTRIRIIKYLFILYKTMYNDSKYFYYTRRRIIKYLFLLYKTTYNKIFVYIIQDDV